MIDFDRFPDRPWCWTLAYEWLRAEAVDGCVEVSVRALAFRAQWKKNEAERFLRRLVDEGLVTTKSVGSGRTQKTCVYLVDGKQESEKPSSSRRTQAGRKPDISDDEVQQAFDLYQRAAKDAGWPQARLLDQRRKPKIRGRLKDLGGFDGWRQMLRLAYQAPHLRGENDRGWVPNLDWFLNPANATKVMEGTYAPRKAQGGGPAGPSWRAVQEGG